MMLSRSRPLLLLAAVGLLVACPNEGLELPPLIEGDGLVWQAQVDTPSFWESTDVEVRGGVAYVCTGVKSLTVHDLDPLENLEYEGRLLFPDSHSSFPRCSHLDSDGDRLVVTSHRDEVQPVPWLGLVDIDDRDDPVVLDSWSTELGLEEAAIRGDDVWVAAHDDGLLRFSVAGDSIEMVDSRDGLGNVSRVTTFGDGIAAGTNTGRVQLFGADLSPGVSVELEHPVQALLDLGDGRLAVALGAEGLAVVDTTGAVLSRTETNGVALRLDHLGEGQILVANWSDLRVYDVTEDQPSLRAVDAVFQAGPRPRHLAAGASGDLVVSGEWEGVHALRHVPGVDGPELTPSTLAIKVPADGEPQAATLTLTNEGRLPLSVTDVATPNDWAATPTTMELAPGESGAVEVSFAGSNATSSGELVIHSTDPDEPEAEVSLQAGSNAVFVGDDAPDFSYLGLNTGETHTLSDQFGKVVLLSYFGVF